MLDSMPCTVAPRSAPRRRWALSIAVCAVLITAGAPRSRAEPGGEAAVAAGFWKTFHHGEVMANGVRLHYVEGGTGAPLLLVSGWPESWYAWRRVMPALAAAGRHVIALDPPGFGDSDHPQSGYDVRSVAADLHAMASALGLTRGGPIDVAGHDVGTWIAYAYASDWPADVRRLAVYEAALPGISPPPPAEIPSAARNLKTWHFAFNRLDDLPEILVQGREREFLSWLFHTKAFKSWAIGPADLDEYVRVLSAPGGVRASFAYYRAAFSPEGLADNRARAQHKLSLPVLAIGGEHGVGDAMISTMRTVATSVRGGVTAGCGHFIIEECPDRVSRDLEDFFH